MTAQRKPALEGRSDLRDTPRVHVEISWAHGRAALHDLSPGGMRIELERRRQLRVGQKIAIIAIAEFLRFGPFDMQVVWSQGIRAGLRFINPWSPQIQVMRELVAFEDDPPAIGPEHL